MSNIPDVNLDIRSSNCGTPPYSTPATLVPGTPNPGNLSYSFAYSGGTDGNGNVEVVTGSQQEFKVKSVADQRYHFTAVDIDANSTQISSKDLKDHKVTIVDADDKVEIDYYKIKVTDTGNGGCEFYCDPTVSNIDPG
ncbi:MAG: hypothetical protein V2I57_08910 [Xanthomonadales bacterium]|nr:hypothetical protein [Xanthomonadales bacterium]